MRIAMVSEHASPLATIGGVDAGGQNVHVAALAAALVRRGHDVTVYTRRDDADLPPRVTAPDGYVVEHVPAGPPTEVPKDELLPHMPAFARHLDARWAEERYDVVHAHFWMSGLAAVAAGRANRVPVVQTFHALGTVKRRHQGDRDTSPPRRIRIERGLCQEVDHVVATCSDEVFELKAMGLHRDKVSVVPCGVDVRHFVPDGPAAPAPEGRQRLLAVGRLVERKGVDDAIRALALVPGAELAIAGGPTRDALAADPEAERLRAVAAECGVEDRVSFLGRVSREEMPALFRSAAVVVAVPWYEPFGIVPLEAMACGRPVVASAVGGLVDTVVEGVTGQLVPPRDPKRLAAVLRDLLADEFARDSFGHAGLDRARTRYTWDRIAQETEGVYAQVAARSTGLATASREAVR